MATLPRTFCEQCLTDTTRAGDCERHPFSRLLSMSCPEDQEYYLLLKRLQRSRHLPALVVVAYVTSILLVGGIHFTVDSHTSLMESFIVAHAVLIAIVLFSSPPLVALWVFGVLGRDLVLGVKRRIWGIEEEVLHELITSPTVDADPMGSAQEARHIRNVHREARSGRGVGSSVIR